MIKADFLEKSWDEQVKLSYQGIKELRKYALERYDELPFFLELHDTPLYTGNSGEPRNIRYALMYPLLNKNLLPKLEEFKKSRSERIAIVPTEMQSNPSYYSLTIETWPVDFKNEKFEVMTVEEGEQFSRSVIDFLQKNKVR